MSVIVSLSKWAHSFLSYIQELRMSDNSLTSTSTMKSSSSSDSDESSSGDDFETMGTVIGIVADVLDLGGFVSKSKRKSCQTEEEIEKIKQKNEYERLRQELEYLNKEINSLSPKTKELKEVKYKHNYEFETIQLESLSVLNVGDILYSRCWPIYDNVGVYMGENKVLHVGQWPTLKNIVKSSIGNVQVKPSIITLQEFRHNNKRLIVERSNKKVDEIQLESSSLEPVKYNILTNNSEHFAQRLVNNLNDSEIVRNRVSASITIIFCVILMALHANPIGQIVIGSVGCTILLGNIFYGIYIKHKKDTKTFTLKL